MKPDAGVNGVLLAVPTANNLSERWLEMMNIPDPAATQRAMSAMFRRTEFDITILHCAFDGA